MGIRRFGWLLCMLLILGCEKSGSSVPATSAGATPSGGVGIASPTPGPVAAVPVASNPVTPAPTPVSPTTAVALPLPIVPDNPNAVAIQAPLTPEAAAPVPPGLLTDARQAHEQSAQIAVSSIQSLIAAKDYDNAQRLAEVSIKAYADTTLASAFQPLLDQARASAAARAGAAGADRHAQFLAARDAGIAAMDRQDYAGAVTQFQNALQMEDDPETRGMLQHASNFVGKPRIAIAEFNVIGDVGIPDAGKAVPELMLGRFDPERFQLVDHAWLDSILAQQGLTLTQVAQMPELLRVRRVDAIRYLVVGSISRVGALTISARLVDVASGEVVQTAEIVAGDPAGLQNCLGELTAILQMTNEQKASYLAYRQNQTDALAGVDPAALAAAEAQRQAALEAQRQENAQAQAAAFAQAQHERDALVARDDIKALFAQANYADAIRYIRWARDRYNDATVAQELAAMDGYAQTQYQQQVVQQQNAAAWAQAQAAQAARHQRFVQYRDQGLTALAAGDLLNAMALLQNALNEEDNPDIRGTLDYVVRRMQRPGIAVIDFDIRGDVGMNPREAPHWIASLMLSRFAGDDSPYRIVDSNELQFHLQRIGLTIADVQRDPLQPRLRLLRDQVRFIIVGTAAHGSIRLTTTMIDLQAGRPFQTADFIAQDIRALPDAIAGSALVLQMSDMQKAAYIAQMEYASWMARGDAAAASAQWDAAQDAYANACRVSTTQEAVDRLANATQQAAALRQARRAYDATMAAAGDSARRSDWGQAFELYRQAFALFPTPQARAGMDDARARVIAAARDRHVLYLSWMTSGDDAMRGGDLEHALDIYQNAYELEATADASAAVAQAQRAIADRQQAKQRAYASAMDDGRDAIKDGNWSRAIDAYTRAAGVYDTREAASGLAAARRGQAQRDADSKLLDKYMADAVAARTANDWQQALELHQRAAVVRNTPVIQGEIKRDKEMLAQIQRQNQKQIYDTAMAGAATHVAASQWQEALQDYRTAYQADKTKPAADGIAQATKMINDAAYNKKQYDQALADGAAAAQANQWTKSLAAYQQAAAIDATSQAKAGVDRAKEQLASAAAADKQRQYAQFVTQGDAAARAGDLNKALAAYKQAASVDNTPQVQASIAGIQKQIADAATVAEAKKQYDAQMAAGDAAAKANQWQKALDAYTKAAALNNTAAAQAGLANARSKLDAAASAAAAATDKKKQYDGLMADGAAAAKAGDWQKALDAYMKAAAIDNTPEVRTAMTSARQQIAAASAANAAAEKKKQYDALMAEGVAAGKTGDWQKALDTYNKAATIDNGAEVRTAIANARQQLNAAADAAARKKQYAQFMTDADAAARAGTWQKALDNYTKAAAIDNTAAAQAGVANAKAKVAQAGAATVAAAEKKRQFDAAVNDGDAAGRGGDWQKALDAYTRAAGIDNTQAVQNAIANARKKLADSGTAATAAEAKRKQYTQLMADAEAAGSAGEWQKALDNYNKAAAVENTTEVKAAIAAAKKKLADAAAATSAAEAKKRQYTQFMTDADAAAKAGTWQKALDAYTKAAGLENTPEAQAGIASAKAKLADATEQKKLHDEAVAEGDAAVKASDWQAACDAYTKALAIDKTPAVQTKLTNAKQKLYTKLMADADEAVKGKSWQAALDAYTKAAALNNTPQAQAGIANAKKNLPAN